MKNLIILMAVIFVGVWGTLVFKSLTGVSELPEARTDGMVVNDPDVLGSFDGPVPDPRLKEEAPAPEPKTASSETLAVETPAEPVEPSVPEVKKEGPTECEDVDCFIEAVERGVRVTGSLSQEISMPGMGMAHGTQSIKLTPQGKLYIWEAEQTDFSIVPEEGANLPLNAEVMFEGMRNEAIGKMGACELVDYKILNILNEWKDGVYSTDQMPREYCGGELYEMGE